MSAPLHSGRLQPLETYFPGVPDDPAFVPSQSVIFCGQFNTYLPFLLPAPAFALVRLLPLYLLSANRAILGYARAGDIFNATHRTVFSG